MNTVHQKNQTDLMVYTRRPDYKKYPNGLAHSIHMAYSYDGMHFQPFHNNYGILFAASTIGTDNTIHAKGIKNPWIFSLPHNKFGIVAVRVNEDGSPDEESLGQVLLWTGDSLTSFRESGLIALSAYEYVEKVQCRYDPSDHSYHFLWQNQAGDWFQNSLSSLTCSRNISPAVPAQNPVPFKQLQTPFGAVAGNIISINCDIFEETALYWNQINNISVQVPEAIHAKSLTDITAVKALAFYSDGSTAGKRVRWDTSGIDFDSAGTYQISGTIETNEYPFPLLSGYGDPVIFYWEGSYYCAATNDNTDSIGLYVRKSADIPGLFCAGCQQHLILEPDEKRDFIQAFWAPEFHFIGNELYLFFAVSGKIWGPKCHLMKLKKGGNILRASDWETPVKVVRQDGSSLGRDGITLDMTYFKTSRTSYVVWSCRKNIGTAYDSGSMLYIASVNDNAPWRLTSEPVLLSRPLYGWENLNHTINNEGPFAFLTGGKVYMTYSGGASDTYTYAVGLLSADADADLLNPCCWQKRNSPVLSFYSVKGEYGPGHNSFFTDSDGNLMIAYHAEIAADSPVRCIGIRRIHFNQKGEPIFDLSADRDLNPKLRQVQMKVIL